MKKILFICVLILCFITQAQEELITFDNSLKTTNTYLKGVIPIVNQENDDVSLFLMDAKKVYGYLLNSDFEIKDKLTSEEKSRKYKVLIGSSIANNNDYQIYLTNKQHNKFAFINFSYKNNASNFEEISLDLKDEKFIQTISTNNKFYLLSITKKSSIINIYAFNINGSYVKNKVDLSEEKLKGQKNNEISLYKLITVSSGAYGLSKTVSIKKIDENNPNSIEVTSESTKLYVRGHEMVLSLDQNENFTQVITIDLETFEKNVRQFKKPFEEPTTDRKKTNSYINGNQIYLIGSTSKKFSFTINDYETGSLIKKYSANVDEVISFKNTPIIQKGGMYDGYREMEKTKKFLRKITAGSVGVSVQNLNNGYQISLGGKVEYKGNGGMMMPMGFGAIPVATMGSVTIFFNPTYFAYNAYTHTKSTHIIGLFDSNFNHIDGEIQENAFDKIKNFKTFKSASEKGKTVFKYKDAYILGNYFHWDKKYKLRKFKN